MCYAPKGRRGVTVPKQLFLKEVLIWITQMNKLDMLRKANQNKKTVSFNYGDHPRTVEPYHYGMCGNKEQLSAYQIAGSSRSGQMSGWKNFKIVQIKNLSINKESFIPRKDYDPFDPKYAKIMLRVEI